MLNDKMDDIIGIMKKVVHIIAVALAAPCAFFLVVWVLLITSYVVGRAFFGTAWLFVEEVTGFWLVATSYLCIAYALWHGQHIRIDFVTDLLPIRVRRGLKVVSGSLAVPITSYMTWRAVEWFVKGFERKMVTASIVPILYWPFYLIIVIGLAAFSFSLTLELCLSVIGLVQGRDIGFEKGGVKF